MPKLTLELIEKIAKVVKTTGAIAPALALYDISKTEWAEWKAARDTDELARLLFRVIRRAKAEREIEAAQAIQDAAPEDYKAALVILQAGHAKRWARKPVSVDGLVQIPQTSIVGVDIKELIT